MMHPTEGLLTNIADSALIFHLLMILLYFSILCARIWSYFIILCLVFIGFSYMLA